MKTVSIGEFKANLSEYAERVQKGDEFIVTYGRKKKKIFKISPYREKEKGKRKLGMLKGKAKAVFSKDWKMTTEEFLGS